MTPSNKNKLNFSMFDAFLRTPRKFQPKKKPAVAAPTAAKAPAANVAVATPAPTVVQEDVKIASLAPSGAEWTEEHSLLLMQLKDTEGKSWKEIQAQMAKFSQKELKQRYRGLKNGGDKATGQGNDGGAAKDSTPEEKPAATQPTEEMKIDQQIGEEAQVNIDPGDDEPMDETKSFTLAADEWTQGEVALLHNLAATYDKHKWLHIASQFYDRTGIRVSADAVRQKIE